MVSRYLYIPLFVLLIVFFFLAQNVTTRYAYYIISVFLSLAAVYFLEPQINWWWWQRHPPDLAEGLKKLLEKHCTFYQGLTKERQQEFRTRVFLFSQNKAWKPQKWEKVPEDIKAMIASGPVTLYFGKKKEYLTEDLENIVVYPGHFPSPAYPRHWHAAETYAPDGVLLFSAQHVGLGFTRSQEYLDLSLYEYAKNYWQDNTFASLVPDSATTWPLIEAISGFSPESLHKFIGLPEVDTWAVVTTLFFTHARIFAAQYPEVFSRLKNHFG